MREAVVIGFFMIVVGIPILAVFGLAAYSRWVKHRQLQLVMEERKLLIEKGVTDLPPLELPDTPGWPMSTIGSSLFNLGRGPLRNLKAGIVLLFISAALLALHFWEMGGVQPSGPLSEDSIGLPVILAALGVALLLIHFITVRYENRDGPKHELSGQEKASVIEVDIEE